MGEGSWVGLDVHARSVVAGVIDEGSGEVRSLRVPAVSGETVAWLQTLPPPVRVVYEAGPTGYRLARACGEAGIGCVVAAPSREEEAARDLVRAREDARGDLMRARHRLSKLLLRHGLVYEATAWTRTHDAWLRRQRFQGGPLAIVFDECYGRMLDAKTRRDALDTAIAELAATPPYVEVVSRLVCLRGVSTLTAFALTVELGDWHRFRPESLGPFLGLTPSEHSSGERRRQGAITKAGNSHVRRLLIEAAWHQRPPSRRSITLERRRTGKPLAVQAQAERSARRLHARWQAPEARGKPRSIVVVAVARELVGHCRAIATME